MSSQNDEGNDHAEETAWPSSAAGLRHRKHSNIHSDNISGNDIINNDKEDDSSPWPQMLPSIPSASYDNYDCPATRAANAVQVLASQPLPLDDDDDNDVVDIDSNEHEHQHHDLSRMDTVHTSHHFDETYTPLPPSSPSLSQKKNTTQHQFSSTPTGQTLTLLSTLLPTHTKTSASSLAGFLALLLVTCANYVLGPMRDAAALAVGVRNIPLLTLISTVLALGSSVPVGWLFEAPDPKRRRVWRKLGLTRGETQGSSLALFYRVFGFLLWSYAVGFWMVERNSKEGSSQQQQGVSGGQEVTEESLGGWIGILTVRLLYSCGIPVERILDHLQHMCHICGDLPQHLSQSFTQHQSTPLSSLFVRALSTGVNRFGSIIYVMFFLVVHLMKLHSLSLIWGVTTEAMEYEENAERRKHMEEKKMGMGRCSSAGGLVLGGGFGKEEEQKQQQQQQEQSDEGNGGKTSHSAVRLKRLGFVGFGGTLGGILGSLIASFTAHTLNLSGLLILAAILLEISANLSIELGRIMQRHWEEQMRYASCGDLTSLSGSELSLNGKAVDSSMKKSVSLGSMKRVASSQRDLSQLNNNTTVQNNHSNGGGMTRAKSIGTLTMENAKLESTSNVNEDSKIIDDNSFKQRLLRGVTTILRSRLLMAIFTYNALYASTSVLLSFQRAELVVNRSSTETSAVSNTAFLAKINTASSVAVFALQASGLGALIATSCGQRGSLALMPLIRLFGVFLLGWWHWWSGGQPPDLMLFLIIDEFTKVINFAIAKPVRENLWRGLSAEARYEAKPIVDTLANRWGGGSAAFLVSFINRIAPLLGVGEVDKNGEMSIFGFPPVLLLCMIISAWWTAVSADVGNIRSKIDIELKKQQ